MIASDYEVNSQFALVIFCVTFSLSVVSLEMVIFDIMGIGSNEGRRMLWYYLL